MTDDNLPKPISLNLNGNPGQISFNTYKELDDWAHKEEEIWSAVPISNEGGGSVFSQLRQQIANVKNFATLVTNRQPSGTAFVDQVAGQLSSYANWNVLHSQTKQAQQVIALAKTNPNEASALLWAIKQWNRELLGISAEGWNQIEQNNTNRMASVFGAVARVATTSDTWGADDFAARKAALTSIEKDLVARGAEWSNRMADVAKEHVDYKNKFNDMAQSQQKLFEDCLKKHSADLHAQLTESQTKVAGLEAIFGQKIADEHRAAIPIWGALSYALVLCPFLALGTLIIFNRHLIAVVVGHLTTQGGLALMLFFVVLYLAAARLVVKQYASHQNLRNDAAERVVMAETFLALIMDKKISDAERVLVLAPLFRPSGTSVDSDVAAGLADAIAKAVTSHKT
jgi:hypothetical protein